ncbi:MAG: AMP-binding protein [Acidimicrobiia bacterium]|nr:AMP-binding protein [Acidimicrobiia bacterium]
MLEAETLWGLVEARAEATPDAELACDESGRRITFGAYRQQCERVAAGLVQAHGLGPGDTVTWQLPTWLESMVLVGAVARLGARQNPILHIYRQREVEFCAAQVGAKLLVTPTSFGGFDFGAMADEITASQPATAAVRCDRTLPEADPDPDTLPAPPIDPDEIRWYFYTSGTTSDPKGAQHTDATVIAVARGMAERLEVTNADVNALAFPFPHIGGITWLVTGLLTGCRNVCFEAFVPDTVVGVLDAEGVTLAGSGTVFHQTYLAAQRTTDQDLFASVRAFPGGGAPKPPQLHYDMKAAFPGSAGILSGYGLTEAPILTMSGVHDSDRHLAETEGFAMAGVELKLVRLDGEPAGVGEEGEIRAKAPQLMLGYLDSSLDAEAFDDEGYFRTGDLGMLDAEGYLTITGRLKDVIIRKGENISAKELEDLLHGHDAVADVAVIGLPDPDSGERACAVVVPADPASPLTLAELCSHLTDAGLMRQKLPEQLEVVDALPRNPAGKVLKKALVARFEGAPHERTS